jgi:hypothetical protein
MTFDTLNLLLCAGVLCLGGGALLVVLQFLGGFIQIIGGLLGFFFELLNGGPLAWCGCLIALGGGCGLIVLVLYLVQVLPQCGTPQAINLCRLLGY